MARIPDEAIERLKGEVSVQRLAEARGVTFTRHGADLIGRCPFHEDRTPSLVVTPAKNLWHCLGACQAGGTVIDWVMRAEGVSFRHAAQLLLHDSLPLAVAGGATPPKRSSVRKLSSPIERDVEDARLLAQVIDYYHETLLTSPEALDYLKRRGIGSQDAIGTFKLGYANRTLGYRLPQKNRVEGAAMRGQLQRIGLLRESGHEHFNGSIVIPVLSAAGEVTEIYGRKVHDNLREGTPLHLYLPGAHRGVWNEGALAASPEIILCEALIDALTFWCAGYRNVTASYGVEGFTADHLRAFKHCGTERVLIAYDRDEAGDRAAEKLARQLEAEGLDCYRILLPKGMDANEYALKVGPAAKSLGVAIRSAQWLGKGAAPAKSILAASPIPPRIEVVTAPPPPPPPPPSNLPPLAAKEETALPAAAIPAGPAVPAVPESKPLGAEREYVIAFAERRYRVRGLEKNPSYEVLKINVLVSRVASGSECVHVDTFDLYQARHRAAFIKQAAIEIGVTEEIIKADLARLLLALEAEQEKLIVAAAKPEVASAAINEAERAAAIEYLKNPKLIERIAEDIAGSGIVGERGNALVGYLAAVSRKLDRPLALLIQSTSAAGKSSLMDAVLRLVPEEDRIVYSAMTGQSLFYMGAMDLKHKILAIAEEEGAHRASYALKLLQSEGELTIASTAKDPSSGKLTTDVYHVEGPVAIFSTTTAADLDEELLNRCLVLTVDESREQTAAIHRSQRERRTLAGLKARSQREAILKVHQNAQRLLEPLAVMNPYAQHLTFIDDRTRTRRDHEKYLTLIDAIALLHQHQRPIGSLTHEGATVRYIEVTLADIALANSLAHEVLGRTLDELPPQTRRLLGLIASMVEGACSAQSLERREYRFSRRQVREHTRWGDTQLKVHLARLTELEYLLVHRGGRGQSFEYELLYDGAGDRQHLSGLIDVEALRHAYEGQRSGSQPLRSGVGRPLVGVQSGAGRGAAEAADPEKISLGAETAPLPVRTHGSGNGARPASYAQASHA